jgi:hypothetical protein
MPHFSGGIEIARPPEDVWWGIGTPERWFDGYVESRSRSADIRARDARRPYLPHAQERGGGRARDTLGGAGRSRGGSGGPNLSRHVPYGLSPTPVGTSLRVGDEVSFKGLGKLAAPIASRDVKKRWQTSLEKLKAVAEGGR